MGITTSGWKRLARKLDGIALGLKNARGSRWVGTPVWYAHFPEFGVAGKSASPYFRPALRQVAAEFNTGSLIRTKKRTGFSVLGALDEAVIEPMAERAVELARANVRKKGLIRSGDLERSIVDGKTVAELVAKAKARVTDPRNI